jgi:hypothetical protein
MNLVELKDLSPQQQQIQPEDDSDDSLEPPFEVHGIVSQPIQDSLPFHTTVPIPSTPNKPMSIEDFPDEESEDQNPPSMFFEQRPLLDQPATPQTPTRIFRKRSNRAQQEPKVIESWNDVHHLDEFLLRVFDIE